MTKSTLKRWQRDGLETLHTFKHETYSGAALLRVHAKRVVALADELLIIKSLEEDKKGGTED